MARKVQVRIWVKMEEMKEKQGEEREKNKMGQTEKNKDL